MSQSAERRQKTRVAYDPPLVGIITDCAGKGFSTTRSNRTWGFVFVDVPNLSEGGALIASSFPLGTGKDLELQVCDQDEHEWRTFKADVVWEKWDEKDKLHHCGLQFAPLENAQWCPNLQPSDIRFLLNTHFLQAVPRNALLHLLNCLTRHTVADGTRFIPQGGDGDAMYIIQSGICRIVVEKDGVSHHVARLRKGDLVGEMAVLTGEPRSAHVDAETDLVLWRLDKYEFDTVARNHADLRIFLTELVTNRIETAVVTADRTVGKYIIKRKVGQGGWSMVYQGVHKVLEMPVAIKMLKHDMAMEESFQQKFRDEANIIAQLVHPHIVKVYDIEELYRTIFIIMEYLEGESLRSMLDRMGKLPVPLVVRFLTQVCQGLSYAHEHGIVHQDIKPANIFVVPENHVKILDFGLACAPGEEDLNLAGTVHYASPEQIDGLPVDARADIYSLGLMAYEMLIGHRPFQEDDIAELMDLHVNEEIPDPLQSAPDMPPGLARFIRRASRRLQKERYQSADEALADLREVMREIGHEAENTVTEPRRLASVLLFYDDRLQQAVTHLLEEFSQKAFQLGAEMKTAEFKDV